MRTPLHSTSSLVRGRRPLVAIFSLLLYLGSSLAVKSESEPLPELWFPVGEELTYRIYWGVIPVAKTVATSEWVEEDGRTLLAIRYRTRSNKVIATVYPVNDLIESIIDPVTFLPVRFTKKLSEGRYETEETTLFDHEAGEAHWHSFKHDSDKTFPIEKDTRCLVSFSYFLRKKEFVPKEKQEYRVMADDKIYDLWLNVGKYTRVKLPRYGKRSSIEIEPEAAFDGLFIRTGKINLWVSNDERKLLTQATAKVPVASIRLVLDRVRGPGDDHWILPGDEQEDDEEDEQGE